MTGVGHFIRGFLCAWQESAYHRRRMDCAWACVRRAARIALNPPFLCIPSRMGSSNGSAPVVMQYGIGIALVSRLWKTAMFKKKKNIGHIILTETVCVRFTCCIWHVARLRFTSMFVMHVFVSSACSCYAVRCLADTFNIELVSAGASLLLARLFRFAAYWLMFRESVRNAEFHYSCSIATSTASSNVKYSSVCYVPTRTASRSAFPTRHDPCVLNVNA